MKNRSTLEALIYVAVIALCLCAFALAVVSVDHFSDTQLVYQGF